ncbi:hypothetical protein KIN20_028219 [Parelaphostrongylus tenuis]|uniref:Uncharacterized protein n=1 Tax=Parelaphostrongylus tenuis TaxID=148309 RepID=A0AAD5WEI4_PARTN|nr:hypothetical protein KIN20_028219 [Parelaphostrongylus tenuis]
MVYSAATDVQAQVPGSASNRGAAHGFVQRLVMQTVLDVLESQARSAFLPDALISTILGQLSVNITYEPMECPAVAITREEMVQMMRPQQHPPRRCIIAGTTVTGICIGGAQEGMCKMSEPNKATITIVPGNYTSVSGTLMTTNLIMANWSRQIWQNVLNRAVRMLASGPFGTNFISASGTVRGKLKLNHDMLNSDTLIYLKFMRNGYKLSCHKCVDTSKCSINMLETNKAMNLNLVIP